MKPCSKRSQEELASQALYIAKTSPGKALWINEAELSELIDADLDILRQWRKEGKGPPFNVLYGQVLYDYFAAQEFLAQRVSHPLRKR